jgi:hypothetical protein
VNLLMRRFVRATWCRLLGHRLEYFCRGVETCRHCRWMEFLP